MEFCLFFYLFSLFFFSFFYWKFIEKSSLNFGIDSVWLLQTQIQLSKINKIIAMENWITIIRLSAA